MADRPTPHQWTMRICFFALVMVIIFFHLLPLDTVPRRWAPPDLIIAFTFAWVLRRPDYVPAVSVALVILLADLMFQRPPGLLALLVVLGTEYLKYRTYGPGESSFLAEWAAVCIVVIAITLGYRLALALTLVPTPPLGVSMIQMVLTIVSYPVVVMITQMLMGVRKLAPSDNGTLGGRL